METLKPIKQELHIDEATLKDVGDALEKAYLNGWESDDGFLLATGFKY